MIDYTAVCPCNHFEKYSTFVNTLRNEAGEHMKEEGDHEIYIDRNIDYEIDDTFSTVIINNK